jgi:hypothetical protein
MQSPRTTETQGNHDLFDAFGEPGCPICTLSQQAVSHYMRSTNYEPVSDPDIRKLFVASQGFCNLHAHQWLEEAFVLGTAQIYRDVLRATFDDLKGQAYKGKPLGKRLGAVLGRGDATEGGLKGSSGSCPACDVLEETETRSSKTLLAGLREEGFRSAYAESDGLCIPHLRVALADAPSEVVFDALKARAVQTRETLLAHLDETIRKHDYRFRHEPAGEERGSPHRAVDHVSSAPGVMRRSPR